jgi:LPPG:FO 2-phospho-L-lactate transferase
VIGNTGDDLEWNGLHICPDLDTVLYWLAGVADEERGWGIRNDTFITHRALSQLTGFSQNWFQVGDRDLATHLYRTARLREGEPLSGVITELAERMGVSSKLLPMSDEPIRTRLKTDLGDLSFQEYFVRERFAPRVQEIYWTGLEGADPAPGIQSTIEKARAILIAPSNPIISISPILEVQGMRDLMASVRSRTVAISPLIGGRAIKGPTVELMRSRSIEPNSLAIAALYRDIACGFVIDPADEGYSPAIQGIGYRVSVIPTLLDDQGAAAGVATAALDLVDRPVAA